MGYHKFPFKLPNGMLLLDIFKSLPPDMKLKCCLSGEINTVQKWIELSTEGVYLTDYYTHCIQGTVIIHYPGFGKVFIEEKERKMFIKEKGGYKSIWTD